MLRHPKSKKRSAGAAAAARLISECVLPCALVVMAAGALCAALGLRGVLGADGLERGAQAALFLGSLASAFFVCRRGRKLPFLWGVVVGAALALLCLLIGACTGAVWPPDAALHRFGAALIGGLCGGVLSVFRKK